MKFKFCYEKIFKKTIHEEIDLICVSINKSNAVSGSYYGKVMSRGRVNETMLANRMKEASCGLNEALIQYVLSLFSDAVLEYVSSGYIVDMAGLGSMFLSVKGEVADLTISLAGKIISKNLDSHAHKELIDQYIDQLGEA